MMGAIIECDTPDCEEFIRGRGIDISVDAKKEGWFTLVQPYIGLPAHNPYYHGIHFCPLHAPKQALMVKSSCNDLEGNTRRSGIVY